MLSKLTHTKKNEMRDDYVKTGTWTKNNTKPKIKT